MKAGLDGVVLGEGSDDTKRGERAQLMDLVDGKAAGDIEWPAVDDAVEVDVIAEACEQLTHLLGHRVFIT